MAPKHEPLFDQMLLDTHDELIVDLFAGGGGASSGIEQATGRQVDVAINHDSAAVALHQANHPQTLHLVSDVFEVDPRAVTKGRPVGLLWASPDCTHHSKARGGKPLRTTKRRALAWVVTRWAGQVRPRVVILENVEEFAQWGPLVGQPGQLRPCKKRRGRTFRKWVRSLERFDYRVEWRELRACDYGAPTIRKRLFLIARCDGLPIVWPEPTHGPSRKHPYRTAASCIDWDIPMLSIFATKDEAKEWGRRHGQAAPIRPLADNTLRRIARGVKRYVLENPKPFLVTLNHGGDWQRPWDLDHPIRTLTSARDAHALVAPYLVPRYGERDGQEPRARSAEEPSPVVVPSGNGASLVAANLSTYHDGGNETPGASLDDVAPTLTTKGPHEAVVSCFLDQCNNGFANRTGRSVDQPLSAACAEGSHKALVATHIQRDFGTSTGHGADRPLGTITTEGGGKASLVATHLLNNTSGHSGASIDAHVPTITNGGHAALVASFLATYYGTEQSGDLQQPLGTQTTRDRFGLVTVTIEGQPYVICDIAMRMLQPRELYRAQGFRPGYVIDRGADGRQLTKTEQVRMCGNSVCPPVAEALVAANCADLMVRKARPERVRPVQGEVSVR
jgi:DNA (cytosine-5)-methyltransferase 1